MFHTSELFKWQFLIPIKRITNPLWKSIVMHQPKKNKRSVLRTCPHKDVEPLLPRKSMHWAPFFWKKLKIRRIAGRKQKKVGQKQTEIYLFFLKSHICIAHFLSLSQKKSIALSFFYKMYARRTFLSFLALLKIWKQPMYSVTWSKPVI